MEVGSPQWKKFMIEQCDVPEKFINYLATGFHFQFEEADKQENIEWFNHFSKKHLEFMDFHCNWTYPTFQWICYRKWRGKGNDPCKEKAKIMNDEIEEMMDDERQYFKNQLDEIKNMMMNQ